MDPDQLVSLIEHRKWVPLAALVIGVITRLIKSDTKLPIDVPPRARIWVVIVLGATSAVLEKVVDGRTWTSALAGGAVSVAIAVLGHETIIASLRSGKEFPVPGLMVEGKAPSPTAPVTVEAPVAPGAVETRATPKFTIPPPEDRS